MYINQGQNDSNVFVLGFRVVERMGCMCMSRWMCVCAWMDKKEGKSGEGTNHEKRVLY